MQRDAWRYLAPVPGLCLAGVVAAAAWLLAAWTPPAVTAVPLAVVLGLVIGSVVPRSLFDPGIDVATKHLLRLGIVLLGARLSLGEVAQLGIGSVGLVVLTVAVGFVTAWLLGGRLGLPGELSALLGVGSAICGNTAIMASAPVVRARSQEVGLAVATITLCGTAALLTYPFVGRALGLDDVAFGLWAGLAIQDTSQVVAAGAAFSDPARDVAIVVKLVRNASLAAVLPLLAWWWQRRAAETTVAPGWRKAVPGFVFGFLAVVGLRTAGVIDATWGERLGEVAAIVILIAVAGLGLSIRVEELRHASGRAIGVGAVTAGILGVLGLAAALLVGPLLG